MATNTTKTLDVLNAFRASAPKSIELELHERSLSAVREYRAAELRQANQRLAIVHSR